MPKQTICLSMIVKDEAPVIARCLASVLPIIDHWIICDTGSTDGTQDIISDFFQKHGKPGELHQSSWQDFAHNRTEALALARPRGDYTLIIDADDLLVLPPRYKRPLLTADSYTLDIVHLELRHARTQLVRSALPWRYEGVLHEFLSYPGRDGARIFPETKNQRSLVGVEIHVGEEGARRRSDAAARFARDAQTVSSALLTETDPFLISRYTFYLARSQADAGDKASALETYLKRASLGFWQQEVFISLYEAARIKVDLEHEEEDVIAAFTRAAEADRNRAEALYSGARYCRERGQYQQGYKFAKRGINLRPPPDALFVQPWIYEYGLLDEFAVNAYWTGDYNACLQACRRLLKLGGRLPADYRPRVEANARFARDKMREPQGKEPLATTEPDSASPEAPVDPAPEPPAVVQEQPTSTSEPQPNGEQPTPGEHAAPTTPVTGSGKTLHVLGVAHTIPHEDYLVCAFTGKVLAFPDLVQPHGWHVVEYSNEGSSSNAREHIVVLTRPRLQELSKRRSRDDPMDADVTNEPLQEEFQRILLDKIKARAQSGDIVCHVFGPNMQVVDAVPKCHHVELNVGYTASPGLHFRIYETSAWMHWHHGKAGREDGSNYQWVIPTGFDVDAWPYCNDASNYAVFLGRVNPRKGIQTLVDIARRMPELPIHVYGPGDSSQWQADRPDNLHFKGPVFGAERVEVVRRARCMLMPTAYIEPFGNAGVEAQLCGVPLIGTSFGAFQETIIDGVTGYRCHTLADWLAAIRLSATLDRKQISDLARRRYSREAIGQQYNWALQQLADLSQGGWYGEVSRKFPDPPPAEMPRQPRIWLYMPHFGAVPNYFQLYLDSLARNADLLSVIFITDVDLSSFSLPDNLIVVPSTLDAERQRAATFLREALGMDVDVTSLLTTPYKFVDLKITYLDLFRDIGADHGITENDYVGWGDCDLIYGRLADFISMDTDYAVIGGLHGHFTAFKNKEPLRTLYRQVEPLPSILLDHNTHIADEIAFRPYLLKYLEENNGQMFYTNRYFCDIVPEQFFSLFRNDHSSRPKNFFDAYNSDKDIDHVHCDQDGKLVVHYDDGTTREAIYCHLQKRKMTLLNPRQSTPFLIQADAFVPPPVATAANNEENLVAESAPAATSSPSQPADQGPNLGTFGQESLIDQHALRAARTLHSVHDAAPRVLVAILAKQKEAFLPFYLECIEALDYPKTAIVLYVRTNNNTDATETILRDWLARVGHLYAHVEFDPSNVDVKVEQFGAHEWNAQRFEVLGHIRNVSLQAAKTHSCDYYFVADVDNFIRPCTLRELVALRLPIVSPLLRSIVAGAFYSNYHAEIDANGYFRACDQYQWILNRWVRGVVEVPVVHCTYLVRTDVIDQLTYLDGSSRYEYVVFSDSSRMAGVPQYVDNRQIYGYITFGEGHDQHVVGGLELIRDLIRAAADGNLAFGNGVQLATQADPPLRSGRRAIRLKEFPPSTELRFEPTEAYVHARAGALEQRPYLAHTDEHGFIRSRAAWKASRHSIVVLGDSVVESMFLDPEQRFPALLEELLRKEHGLDVTVLNGGYSGATTLHVFNTLLNKVVPLKPDVVIWMTGIVDIDAARLPASYWTRDCWLEPLVDLEKENTWRDMAYQSRADYSDRERLLELACDVVSAFSIELCFATTAHRQTEQDNAAAKLRDEVNDVTRRVARRLRRHVCDLEANLAGRRDLFHDAFHLNVEGSRAVAIELAQSISTTRLSRERTRAPRETSARLCEWADRWSRIDGAGRLTELSSCQSDTDTYVINLDESTERLERFRAKNAHVQFQRFSAVSGRALDPAQLVREKLIEPHLDYGRGALGCALSHIQLWELAATLDITITVAEDDVVFCQDFSTVTAGVISSLEDDWEFILWGFVHDPHFAWVDYGFASAELRFYNRARLEVDNSVAARVGTCRAIRLLHAFGTQAYTVTPKGARSLLSNLLPLSAAAIPFPDTPIVNTNEGIDTAMCAVYPKLRAFVCLPPVAYQQDFGVSARRGIQ